MWQVLGEKRYTYRVMVGKPEGHKPLRRPIRRLDNIKMILKEMGMEGVQCINLLQARDSWRALVNTVMNLSGSIKCGDFLGQLRICQFLQKDPASPSQSVILHVRSLGFCHRAMWRHIPRERSLKQSDFSGYEGTNKLPMVKQIKVGMRA